MRGEPDLERRKDKAREELHHSGRGGDKRRLSETDAISVSELARPFTMSLPAVMKHLDVLSDAGLVIRNKTGRTVSCRLRAEPMERANEWLNRYQRFWTERLDQLAAFLEEESCPPPQPLSQASPSSGA